MREGDNGTRTRRTNDGGPGLPQQLTARGFPGRLCAGMEEKLSEWSLTPVGAKTHHGPDAGPSTLTPPPAGAGVAKR